MFQPKRKMRHWVTDKDLPGYHILRKPPSPPALNTIITSYSHDTRLSSCFIINIFYAQISLWGLFGLRTTIDTRILLLMLYKAAHNNYGQYEVKCCSVSV